MWEILTYGKCYINCTVGMLLGTTIDGLMLQRGILHSYTVYYSTPTYLVQ